MMLCTSTTPTTTTWIACQVYISLVTMQERVLARMGKETCRNNSATSWYASLCTCLEATGRVRMGGRFINLLESTEIWRKGGRIEVHGAHLVDVSRAKAGRARKQLPCTPNTRLSCAMSLRLERRRYLSSSCMIFRVFRL